MTERDSITVLCGTERFCTLTTTAGHFRSISKLRIFAHVGFGPKADLRTGRERGQSRPEWDDILTELHLRVGAPVVNLSLASFNVHNLRSNRDKP